MKRYEIFFERKDGYMVVMVAMAKEFRDLKLRMLSAINTDLKVLDLYIVDNMIKKINKSHFKEIITDSMSGKRMDYVVECYKRGKALQIHEHMMQKLEERIKADPPEED